MRRTMLLAVSAQMLLFSPNSRAMRVHQQPKFAMQTTTSRPMLIEMTDFSTQTVTSRPKIEITLQPTGRSFTFVCEEERHLASVGVDPLPQSDLVAISTEQGEPLILYGELTRVPLSMHQALTVCAGEEGDLILAPDVAQKLIPGLQGVELGPGDVPALGTSFCLEIRRAPARVPIDPNWFSWAENPKQMEAKYSPEIVKQSWLLTLESWLYFASDRQDVDIANVQDGAIFEALEARYANAEHLPPRENETAFDARMDPDLERFHMFGDRRMIMPPDTSEDDAKQMLRELVRRRLRKPFVQCADTPSGGRICQFEIYAQAFTYIAGSLLAVALQALSEQVQLAKRPFDPAAVAFYLFSKYLESEIGSFHVPDILELRKAQEADQIFGAYVTGHSSLFTVFAPVPPPKEAAGMMTRLHVDKLIMQHYTALAFTASGNFDSLETVQWFWRFFLKAIANRDTSVVFFRTALLLALSGPEVMVKDSAERYTTAAFSDILATWLTKQQIDAEDPEAPAVISHFTVGLRHSMQASGILAKGLFEDARHCSSSDLLKKAFWRVFKMCRNSLSSWRSRENYNARSD